MMDYFKSACGGAILGICLWGISSSPTTTESDAVAAAIGAIVATGLHYHLKRRV